MSRGLRRTLFILLGLLVVVVITYSAALWWFGLRPIPPTTGSLRLPGLSAPVTVYRDNWGVPHIFAANASDLFQAQGYIQAGDRLWQMEFQRRTGHGRLSEALGEATVNTDRFLRTLGISQSALADYAVMDPTTRGYLEAYTRGVNAYIDSHRDNLPIEFTLLGFKPEPWTPLDSLVWGKMLAWDLGGNWDSELMRARMVGLFGAEGAQELLPPYPEAGVLIVPNDVRAYQDLGQPDVAAVLADLGRVMSPVRDGLGSNNWVVAGSKTASGKPLLADDPHLAIRLPSVWWEVGLHGGGFDVVGASLVGVPGVIIGHNNRIAWAVTNVGPDVQDLYIERVRGLTSDRPEYEFQGQWAPVTVRQEVIKVKGKPDENLRVLSTRHGPLLNYVVSGLEQPVAFKWTALTEPNELFRSVAMLDRAQNFQQFRDALRLFAVPSQNFIYADVDGNIGYQMPGRVPRRTKGLGQVPAPGWTGEYEWGDYIPFEDLPSIYNPPSGYIATANNRVIGDQYPYFITDEWAAPYRAQRIVEVLSQGSRLTVEDMKRLHGDTLHLFNQDLARRLGGLQPTDKLQQDALNLVRQWDGRHEIDSVGASIVEATYRELLRLTFADEMPRSLFDEYFGSNNWNHRGVARLLDQPDNVWWDNKTTGPRENRDAILAQAFEEGVNWLKKEYGSRPADWQWGKLHTATFQHGPLGQSGLWYLERLLNRGPIPARGGGFTVNAASFSYRKPFALSSLASYRQVIDLGDLSNSWSIHTTGQSGHPFSPYYDNMIKPWQNVEYHRMLFTEDQLKAARGDVLTLTP